MRQDVPQATVGGDSFWSRGCLIYPRRLVLARYSAVALTGKARIYQKADDHAETHQPTWTPQAQPLQKTPLHQHHQEIDACPCSRAPEPR